MSANGNDSRCRLTYRKHYLSFICSDLNDHCEYQLLQRVGLEFFALKRAAQHTNLGGLKFLQMIKQSCVCCKRKLLTCSIMENLGIAIRKLEEVWVAFMFVKLPNCN